MVYECQEMLSLSDLVKAGMLVVGCGRRVERIVDLATSLKGEKGKVLKNFFVDLNFID